MRPLLPHYDFLLFLRLLLFLLRLLLLFLRLLLLFLRVVLKLLLLFLLVDGGALAGREAAGSLFGPTVRTEPVALRDDLTDRTDSSLELA